MNTKILGAFAAAAIIALAALSFVQRSEIADLKRQLDDSQKVLVASETEKQGLVEQIEDLDSQLSLATAQSMQFAENVEPEALAEGNDSSANSSRRINPGMTELMENPTFNKIMVASQRATLEVLYDDLADFLVLDEKEKKYFMDLLVARQMVRVEGAMKMMSGQLNQEERKAMQAEMKASNEQTGEEMEYFLNNEDDLEEWKFYEKTIGERMALSGYKQALAQSDMPLDAGVDRQLVEIMHAEKEKFSFSSDLHDQESTDMSPNRFSPDNIDAFEEDLKDLDTLIAERVLELLSSGQFEQFLASQEQMRNLQVSQLRMASQMFSQNGAPATEQ